MIKKCEWSKKYLALLSMLLIPIILSSCSMWDNPISPIDEGQTDKRLRLALQIRLKSPNDIVLSN